MKFTESALPPSTEPRRRLVALRWSSTIAAGAAGLLAASMLVPMAASAHDEPMSEHYVESLTLHEVAPALEQGTAAFYSQDQLPEVWSTALANNPESLPPGYAYPTAPPSTIVAGGHPGQEQFFEVGYVESVLGDIYRCSWLDYRALPGASAQGLARASAALDRFLESPLSAAVVDAEYSAFVSSARQQAARAGVDPFEVQFDLECAGVEVLR